MMVGKCHMAKVITGNFFVLIILLHYGDTEIIFHPIVLSLIKELQEWIYFLIARQNYQEITSEGNTFT